jgi:hypothetical protein
MSTIGANSRRLWRVMYAVTLLLYFAVLISCTPLVPLVPVTGDEPTATPTPSDGPIPVTVLDENGQPFDKGVIVRVSNSAQADGFDNSGCILTLAIQIRNLLLPGQKAMK